MKAISILFPLFTLVIVLFSLVREAQALNNNNNGLYIVYMGAASTDGSLRDDHAKLLNSLFRRYY